MATCVACEKPLILQIEDDDEHDEDDQDESMGGSTAVGTTSSSRTVPDDVELTCGCHFHWQCLLDAYTVTECPNCSSSLMSTSSTNEQQLLCTLRNEGGVQENLDILPLLTEEGYLNAFPNERKCRAFLEFCREGDTEAIVDLLQNDESQSSDGADQPVDVLSYQDPIGGMHSGLHIAILTHQVGVAWLLLLLGSRLPLEQFPVKVLEVAEQLGIMRDDMASKTDIRSLRDDKDRTCSDLAYNTGGIWREWATGRLNA